MKLEAIGTIRTPHLDREGMPIQPSGARGVTGTIEVDARYAPGLRDLDGFSHVIALYWFHQGGSCQMEVTPFLDEETHGIFATRAPRRPNPIGLSVLRLVRVEGSLLHVADVDILDGTPLLDLKPYVPEFDTPVEVRTGWLERAAERARAAKADRRFVEDEEDGSP